VKKAYLWIGGIVVGFLLLGGAKALQNKNGGGGGGEKTHDPGRSPDDYPEPPIPGNVMPGWNKPGFGWKKTVPPDWVGKSIYKQDAKGYWWNVPSRGVGG